MAETKLRLLMIGPLPPPVGGARVLFKNTIDYIQQQDNVQLTVIPLWVLGQSSLIKFLQAIKIFFRVLLKARSYDVVSLWASRTGMISLAPFLKLACMINQKPLVLRFFGFNFDRALSDYPPRIRIMTRLAFQAGNLILLETRIAADLMQGELPRANIEVHGNYRTIPPGTIEVKDRCSKFVYLGKINPRKGVLEIIQAASVLGSEEISIDIYGPFEGGLTAEIFKNSTSVHYCGIVDPDTIPDLLNDYHVLLLPSTYKNEGHPGVILEAYASGLPVIASNLPGISEIVDDRCGILITPGNVQELSQAMLRLISQPAHYRKLVESVLRIRENYSLEKGVDRFLIYCSQLIQ